MLDVTALIAAANARSSRLDALGIPEAWVIGAGRMIHEAERMAIRVAEHPVAGLGSSWGPRRPERKHQALHLLDVVDVDVEVEPRWSARPRVRGFEGVPDVGRRAPSVVVVSCIGAAMVYSGGAPQGGSR
jgi:hypothetical protein